VEKQLISQKVTSLVKIVSRCNNQVSLTLKRDCIIHIERKTYIVMPFYALDHLASAEDQKLDCFKSTANTIIIIITIEITKPIM
jgi:hypothetical protein